jgi:hypothetical protein
LKNLHHSKGFYRPADVVSYGSDPHAANPATQATPKRQ